MSERKSLRDVARQEVEVDDLTHYMQAVSRYRDALTKILAVRLDESPERDQAAVFNEARMEMRRIAEEALRG